MIQWNIDIDTDPSESHKCELYYIHIRIGYLLYFGNH